MIALVSLLMTLQGQQPPAPRVVPPALQARRDSTMIVVNHVGIAVANARSDLDHYRQLVWNDSLAVATLLDAGHRLRDDCRQMTTSAQAGRQAMCTSCLIAAMQPAFNRYRAYLPQVAAVGTRCAARLDAAHLETAKPVELRQLVLALAAQLRTGLAAYQTRVSDVMASLTARSPTPAPQPYRRPSQ